MPKKQQDSPLRNLRRARTISQVHMASLLGVSQQTYCKYERGTLVPTFDVQARIAAILGALPRELFRPKEEAVAS